MAGENESPGEAWTCTSDGTLLIEVTEADTVPGDLTMTPAQLLRLMRRRVELLGSPIPEGFVPPPGIDLAALLRQVPWPPSADEHPAQDE
jgi:hypothetical protein